VDPKGAEHRGQHKDSCLDVLVITGPMVVTGSYDRGSDYRKKLKGRPATKRQVRHELTGKIPDSFKATNVTMSSVIDLVPAPADGSAPVASAYRLRPEEIDRTVCISRRISDAENSRDRRWKPMIYRETQCGAAVLEDGLCKLCLKRRAAYRGSVGVWHGILTEEPPSWMHMLGTSWAEERPPKWLGDVRSSAASSDSASVDSAPSAVSAVSGMSSAELRAALKVQLAIERESAKAAKEAEKAAKEPEKLAQKEALKAQKEAEKAALKAQKEAEKAALKARKDAEKEALKAQKEAEKAAKAAEKEAEKAAKAAQKEAEKAAKAAEKKVKAE
jgi:hypothetical protein